MAEFPTKRILIILAKTLRKYSDEELVLVCHPAATTFIEFLDLDIEIEPDRNCPEDSVYLKPKGEEWK